MEFIIHSVPRDARNRGLVHIAGFQFVDSMLLSQVRWAFFASAGEIFLGKDGSPPRTISLKHVHSGVHSRRFRRQFVDENGDISATVAVFCDSVDRALDTLARTFASH